LSDDLVDVDVVDNHCFMFRESSKELTITDFEHYYFPGGFTVGSGINMNLVKNASSRTIEHSYAFNQFVFELSKFLGCEYDFSKALQERNKRARTDYKQYVKDLFDSEKIRTLLVDNGNRPLQEVENFSNINPAKTEKVFRIEPLIKDLLDESEKSKNITFGGFLERFDERIESAAKRWQCIAFKSVIAYRVGLEIQPVDDKIASNEYQKVIDGTAERRWYGPVVKPLRDYLFLRVLGKCGDLKTVMQVHTGLGDTDIVSSKCNPVLMLDALKDPKYRESKLVLIHGGFPYTIEAGWLANSLPNVYLEISSPVPTYFAPGISVERYKSIVQWVPLTKVIYGSDASEFPENHWLMARMAKRAFSRALQELGSDGSIRHETQKEYMEMVFSSNAKSLYGVK
jgi:predicted TIM-barrel fold metal-dependent hydrolase